MTQPTGPNPSSTPPDYDDLHRSSNPFAAGDAVQNVSATHDAAYPNLASIAGAPVPSIPGYFSNPPPDTNNTNVDGAGEFSGVERSIAREIADGIDASLRPTLDEQTGPWDAPNPYTDPYQQDIRIDTAQDDMFIPLDDRR